MTSAKGDGNDNRAQVRWWITSLGGLAAFSLAMLAVSDMGELNTAGIAIDVALFLICLIVAVSALFSGTTLFDPPRTWGTLSPSEQESLLHPEMSLEEFRQLEVRSASFHEVEAIRAKAEARLAALDAYSALRATTSALWKRVALIVALLIVAEVVRFVPAAKNATCKERAAACGSVDFATNVTRVRVYLRPGLLADVGVAQRALARGDWVDASCVPPAIFEGFAVGGSATDAVVQISGPSCPGQVVVIDSSVGTLTILP